MEVTVKSFQRSHRVDRERVRRTAERTLAALGRGDGNCAVVFVGNRRIREMNRRYRGVDTVTDVLSFPQEGPAGSAAEAEMGDVVISPSRAAEQAAGTGRTLREEIDVLVVHGILHLAGYDHGTPADRREMDRLQRKVLRSVEP
jgi:probable rRNA maturation factor